MIQRDPGNRIGWHKPENGSFNLNKENIKLMTQKYETGKKYLVPSVCLNNSVYSVWLNTHLASYVYLFLVCLVLLKWTLLWHILICKNIVRSICIFYYTQCMWNLRCCCVHTSDLLFYDAFHTANCCIKLYRKQTLCHLKDACFFNQTRFLSLVLSWGKYGLTARCSVIVADR